MKQMKSIITTYPDFQKLPRGLKMLLLVSESFFFSEAVARPRKTPAARRNTARFLFPRRTLNLSRWFTYFGHQWRN